MTAGLLVLILVPLGTALTWWGSRKLSGASKGLAEHYRLPESFEGTVIVAVGSSFPEFSTAVLSTWMHGEFELGMAAIVGSATFNILVIPGLAGWFAGGVESSVRLVYRDALFYLASVAVLLLTFSFALIYRPLEADLRGLVTRPMALLPILLYGVYLFLQQQEAKESNLRQAPDSSAKAAVRLWLQLLGALGLILLGVEGLLRSAILLGDLLQTPSFLWGATVVAAATSVPDAFVSVRVAREGRDEVSLGNVLGSNIFDLLVAVPAGVLIAGSAAVNYGVVAPLMGFLTLATLVLFAALRTEQSLSRREAGLLLAVYLLFILWMGAEALKVTDLVS